MFGRLSRRARGILANAAHSVLLHQGLDPFGPSMLGVRFNSGGGTGAGGGSGEGEGDKDKGKKKDDEGGEEMISKREADRAFRSRDQAKAGLRELARLTGLDPDDIKIVPTGDKENPYRLEAEGLDDIAELLKEGRTARKSKKESKGGEGDKDWTKREQELTSAHGKQIEKLEGKQKKTLGAYEKYVDRVAVVGQIRSACAVEGAIDDDSSGNFEDIVALISPRIRVDRSIDEETGELVVKTTPLSEDGKPMLDGSGKPATVRHLVAEFLEKKPKFRQASFVRGPGAGGYGNPPGSGSGSGSGGGNDKPSNSASFMFGR